MVSQLYRSSINILLRDCSWNSIFKLKNTFITLKEHILYRLYVHKKTQLKHKFWSCFHKLQCFFKQYCIIHKSMIGTTCKFVSIWSLQLKDQWLNINKIRLVVLFVSFHSRHCFVVLLYLLRTNDGETKWCKKLIRAHKCIHIYLKTNMLHDLCLYHCEIIGIILSSNLFIYIVLFP